MNIQVQTWIIWILADLFAATEATSLVLSIITISREEANANGAMEEATMETGRTTKWIEAY